MQTTQLGKTDLTVSRLCLGTMTFGSQVDSATAASMLDACFDAGINFIDTANKYNDGVSEQILGNLLRGRRDSIVLASKVFGKMGEGPDQSGLSPSAIRRAVDESLQRLQTDYLDIYYLHQPDYSVPLDKSLEAMERLITEGKIRHVGVSNYAAWQVCHGLWIAAERGHHAITVVQPMYNVLARGIEQEFLPMCREFGLASVVYNPLAGGLLTAKHRPAAPVAGTRFDGNQQYLDRYWNDTNFDAVARLHQAADQSGRTIVSVALGWLLHHAAADCLILGASRQQHLVDNLAAAQEGPLPEALVNACNEVWNDVRGKSPVYNR